MENNEFNLPEKFDFLAGLFRERERIDSQIKLAIIDLRDDMRIENEDNHPQEKKRKIKNGKGGGDRCNECGEKMNPGKYLIKGLCGKCYQRQYNKKRVKADKHSLPKLYKCIDCGAEIESEKEIEDIVCPKNEMHKMVQK